MINPCSLSYELNTNVTLSNRLVFAPVTTNSANEDGSISDKDFHFYDTVANGYGMVIVGSHAVSSLGEGFKQSWNTYNDKNILGLRRLARLLHSKGTKAVLQLYHAGRMAMPDYINGSQPVAPSSIKALREYASYPLTLSDSEIEQIMTDFCLGVQMALNAGFDGVELQGGNTFLVQQFYSPHSNRRSDQWGGSREARMTFVLRLLEKIQELLIRENREDFIVGYRFSPEEYEKPGIRIDSTKYLLKRLDSNVLSYYHISLSHYKKKSQEGVTFLEEIRKWDLSTPVIFCGQIQGKEDLEVVLEKYPLVSVARAGIENSSWALQTGR
ncbi:NADH-dependent flavin oxidoreductase [Suicoccus acidiformans]|uniref:NADH-dependent flavin oxidoreductase n=1 Tax=Suicoccus acidiformans TaxID=2036206 RepID=A0A347WLY1_9LACT|nr:NADH-dependent flavin oxidoreductase [Suicoccus acidiformans]AXY26088.1 NADH-dependent flavin oxidoreductase [Suicoccus acidiformans]